MQHENKIQKSKTTIIPNQVQTRTPKNNPNSELLTKTLSNSSFTCNKPNGIFFLKAHKCASTTIQNILLRYGMKNYDSLALPKADNTYIGYFGESYRDKIMPEVKTVNGKYQLFSYHTRYNRTDAKDIMANGTLYITILREPLSLYKSMYKYYRLDKTYNLTFKQFSGLSNEQKNKFPRLYGKFGRNQMLFDLGLSSDKFDDLNSVVNYIRVIHENFHLVMIAERLEESLLLLKTLLCCDTDDITSFKCNSRNNQEKEEPLTVEEIINLKNWLKADYMLYDYFSEKLERSLLNFNPGFLYEEISKLRYRNKYWFQRCVETITGWENLIPRYRPFGRSTLGFKLKEEAMHENQCVYMALPEIQFTKDLKIAAKMRIS